MRFFFSNIVPIYLSVFVRTVHKRTNVNNYNSNVSNFVSIFDVEMSRLKAKQVFLGGGG